MMLSTLWHLIIFIHCQSPVVYRVCVVKKIILKAEDTRRRKLATIFDVTFRFRSQTFQSRAAVNRMGNGKRAHVITALQKCSPFFARRRTSAAAVEHTAEGLRWRRRDGETVLMKVRADRKLRHPHSQTLNWK